MTQNRLTYTDMSVSNKLWRVEEARMMLCLLQDEYENSKSLSMSRRYKELQRIITMFTSDPVLVKMKWLSEEMDDELQSLNEVVELCEDIKNNMDVDDMDEEDLKDKLPMPTFVTDIKSKISKMVSSFSVPISAYSSFPSSPSPNESPDSSSVFTFQNDRTCESCFDDNANSKSAPTTPVAVIETPKLAVCRSWPLLKKMISEQFVVSSKHSDNSISSHQNDNLNETENKRAAYRRNEAGRCIIKKDEIPDFQIPPTRKSSTHNKIPDTIVPSLYFTSNSHPSSPSNKNKYPAFRTSSSSPNIHRSEGSSAGFYDIFPHKSPSKGFVNKVRYAMQKHSRSECSFEISSDDYDTNEKEVDIQEAHVFLTKLKEDFQGLSNCNVVSRYLKMKKMLKNGSKLLRD